MSLAAIMSGLRLMNGNWASDPCGAANYVALMILSEQLMKCSHCELSDALF